MTAPPPSLRIQAYEMFRRCVFEGRIRPGQFVSQRELMEMLGMPLGAVREMIPRLEAARLVRTVPKRGLHLAHVDLRLIRNAFQVRGMVEREAIAHFVRSASDAELADIEDEHRAILARAVAGDQGPALLEEATAVDFALHDRMVDSIGNEIMSEIYRVNSMHVRMMALESHAAVRMVPAMHEHLAFIGAMRARDSQAAVASLLHHVRSSRQRVIDGSSGSPFVDPGLAVTLE